MNRSIYMILLLSACGHAAARPDSAEDEVRTTADVWSDDNRERVWDGAAGTTQSIERLAAHLDRQDADTRARMRQAAATLQVDCPYNRAAFQLPVALSIAVDRIDADDLDWAVRREWRRIQAGLHAHVEVLERLGGPELADPTFGDYLLGEPGAMRGAMLMEEEDPLVPTRALVEAVSELVDDYPAPVYDRIRRADLLLRDETGQRWPLKLELIGWRRALKSVGANVRNEAVGKRIDTMVQLISALVEQRC